MYSKNILAWAFVIIITFPALAIGQTCTQVCNSEGWIDANACPIGQYCNPTPPIASCPGVPFGTTRVGVCKSYPDSPGSPSVPPTNGTCTIECKVPNPNSPNAGISFVMWDVSNCNCPKGYQPGTCESQKCSEQYAPECIGEKCEVPCVRNLTQEELEIITALFTPVSTTPAPASTKVPFPLPLKTPTPVPTPTTAPNERHRGY